MCGCVCGFVCVFVFVCVELKAAQYLGGDRKMLPQKYFYRYGSHHPVKCTIEEFCSENGTKRRLRNLILDEFKETLPGTNDFLLWLVLLRFIES